MFNRRQRVVFLLLALAIGVALGYARVKTAPVVMQDTGELRLDEAKDDAAPARSLAGIALGGPFTLVDQDGRTVTETAWPGHYLLLYFGFTHCPDVCPLGLGRLTDALNALPAEIAQRVQPLFVTIDPARDTADELKKYVGLFHPRLQGLTGTDAQIDAVVKTYRVYAQKEPVAGGDPANYMMNHSSYTYLVSPQGAVIDVYAHDTPPADMAAKISATLHAAAR